MQSLANVETKPTILIVEDDKAVRESLRMLLEIYGYEVETFARAEDFIARGVPGPGCCVLLDVFLDGVDGLTVLEELRAGDNTIPVVLLSGRATSQMHQRAKPLSPVAFLDKPLDIDCLLQAIASSAR